MEVKCLCNDILIKVIHLQFISLYTLSPVFTAGFFYLFLFFFKERSEVAQVGLKITM